eukprot:444951_1
MSILSAKASRNENCIKYDGLGDQAQYTMKNWYCLQIKKYMTKHPISTKDQQWNWFKDTECKWQPDTLYRRCKNHKTLKINTRTPKTSKNPILDVAKKASLTLFKRQNINMTYLVTLL